MDSGCFKDRLFLTVCYVNYFAEVYNFWAMHVVSIVYEGFCQLRTEGTEKTVGETPYTICTVWLSSTLFCYININFNINIRVHTCRTTREQAQ